MHQIAEIVVQGGKAVLSALPYPDGQRLRVLVVEIALEPPRLPIAAVRERLKGTSSGLSDPEAPMIPLEEWELRP